MKTLFNKYVWLQLILSILLLFGGSLIIAFAISGKQDVIKDGLNLVVAVTLFIFGFFAILTAFIFEMNRPLTTGFLYGSACIALGVFLCLRKVFFVDYVVLLLAIFFIVIGVVALGKGIILLASKYHNTGIAVITLLLGVISITFGILSLVFQAEMQKAFIIIGGVLLVAAGVFELVSGIKAMANQNKSGKHKKTVHKTESKEEVKELDYTK